MLAQRVQSWDECLHVVMLDYVADQQRMLQVEVRGSLQKQTLLSAFSLTAEIVLNLAHFISTTHLFICNPSTI